MILNDILRTRDVYLITGYTDLRKSIDGLAIKVLESFDLNPLEMKDTAFMYCGKNTGKIKVLILYPFFPALYIVCSLKNVNSQNTVTNTQINN